MPKVVLTYGGFSATIASEDSAPTGSLDCRKLDEPINPDESFEAILKEAIDRLLKHGTLVINCKQGRHRSPTITIVALWFLLRTHTLKAVHDAVIAVYTKTHTPQSDLISQSLERIMLKKAKRSPSRRTNVKALILAATANEWVPDESSDTSSDSKTEKNH